MLSTFRRVGNARFVIVAIRKSLGALNGKNMFDPIEGPRAGPNTRPGLATVVVWHAADHHGLMTLDLRENVIAPPASRTNSPKLQNFAELSHVSALVRFRTNITTCMNSYKT